MPSGCVKGLASYCLSRYWSRTLRCNEGPAARREEIKYNQRHSSCHCHYYHHCPNQYCSPETEEWPAAITVSRMVHLKPVLAEAGNRGSVAAVAAPHTQDGGRVRQEPLNNHPWESDAKIITYKHPCNFMVLYTACCKT
eukprot:scaffold3775_cov29-Prasinocladus_malaysianus.AAC.2